ncbi:MAG: hypothetical protein [Wendovervirus sonii]|uniref:Uncharacterized protein n=1 Tax=phage Lak_Megaphage_Sonny TaxID=3109229 RepID=A0ABZ0Z3J6_9CAUD|nr:MAG: hypothetical protein [phage Lak_Megaphage_Sonny]
MDRLYLTLSMDEIVESFIGIVDTPIFKRKCPVIIDMLKDINFEKIGSIVKIVIAILSEHFDNGFDISDDLKACAYIILYNYNALAYANILDMLENELD